MKTILTIIGARPQFIKHAPLDIELNKCFNSITLHTGQHYDSNMSDIFFDQLGIKTPDYQLDLQGANTHSSQTAKMMVEIEAICSAHNLDSILVYGDTNSTLAAALVAAKENIPLIHIESGLRSFNRSMPEEINRIITDEFSYLLFCPTYQAIENLHKEGIVHDRIFKTGDLMCDMIRLFESKLHKVINEDYYFATIHRPYNTDEPQRLKYILDVLNELNYKVILSLHPRTLSRMDSSNIKKDNYSNIDFINPVGYVDSITLQKNSMGVITDSGGIQKESYMLKKKCVTLRSETEWVETLEGNWNQLIFDDLENLSSILNNEPLQEYYNTNVYGNGKAAIEIVNIIKSFI